MTQTFVTGNPLELAKQIGHELYGEIGEMAFEELELCYASKLGPKTFPDTKMRAFINLNFYWSKSYYKNTVIDDFTECLPDDFAHRKITSASRETMFGCITQDGKKLVSPLFWGYEMCTLPELTAFLGTTDLQDKSNTFNEILEGNETTRDLLKFGNATQDLIDSFAGKTDDLRFDGRSLRYVPNTCFVVGTRPLDNKTYTYLDQSGFWTRFHTIQIDITEDMASNIFTGSFTPTNISNVKEMKARLAVANKKLFDHRSEIANRLDYEEVLLPALQQANDLILCKARALNIGADELINTRLKGDIAREVNAYRILTGASNQELLVWITGRLQHFFDFTFNPIIAKTVTIAKATPITLALSEVLKFSKDTEKTRQEIVDEMKKLGISEGTTNRALKIVNDKGLNKGGYGVYKT
jgi:hypothetical protein